MAYAIVTHSAAATMDLFRQVTALLPESAPEGLLVQVTGHSQRGGGLAVFTAWRSKEDADRFFAEHHLPALTKVLGGPPPRPDTMIEIEADEVLVTQTVNTAST